MENTANLDLVSEQNTWKGIIKRAIACQCATKDHAVLIQPENPNLAILAIATGKGDYTKFDILGKGALWNIEHRSKILRLVAGGLFPNNTDTCPCCDIKNTDIHQLFVSGRLR